MEVAGTHVLIIGGGYVGKRVAQALQEKNCTVTIKNKSTVQELPQADIVVITAAPSPPIKTEEFYGDILPTVVNEILQEKPPKRILYTSSIGVMPCTTGDWIYDDTPIEATTPRAKALLKAEKSVQKHENALIFRLGGIYGPGRDRMTQLKEGKLRVYNKDAYTNLIHVDDVVRSLILLLEKGAAGETYFGVDDMPVKREELYTWLAQEIGVNPPPFPDEAPPAGSRWEQNKRCSNQKLLKLGYTFKYPDYRAGYKAIQKERT